MMGFLDPEIFDPVVHCFARCRVCKGYIPISRNESEQLDIEERKCPKCGAFLDDTDVASSFVYTLIHTRAVASSKKLAGFDLATIPYIGTCVLAWLVGLPFWFRAINNFIYLAPVLLLARWFNGYYRFQFMDNEYNESILEMKKSLALWIFANVLCWIILFL